MGKKDRYEKVYTKDAEVFADVVNYILYGGEEKVQPEDLQELDGEELFAEEFTDLAGWETENPAPADRHKKPGTAEVLQRFHSGMRKVLTFIKYAKDKQKMKELMTDEHSDFQQVDRETARFIKEMTGVEIEIENDKEEINMCKVYPGRYRPDQKTAVKHRYQIPK